VEKQHNEEIYNLYSSLIVRVNKSRYTKGWDQTGSRAHSLTYSVDNRSSSFDGKVARAWRWTLTSKRSQC
jgi:hypothetical protein